MTKLGFLAFLALVIAVGQTTEDAQHKAYVSLPTFSNLRDVKWHTVLTKYRISFQ